MHELKDGGGRPKQPGEEVNSDTKKVEQRACSEKPQIQVQNAAHNLIRVANNLFGGRVRNVDVSKNRIRVQGIVLSERGVPD
jgi:hypothetical protein